LALENSRHYIVIPLHAIGTSRIPHVGQLSPRCPTTHRDDIKHRANGLNARRCKASENQVMGYIL
jgi:hypothetical protein